MELQEREVPKVTQYEVSDSPLTQGEVAPRKAGKASGGLGSVGGGGLLSLSSSSTHPRPHPATPGLTDNPSPKPCQSAWPLRSSLETI